MFHTVLSSGSPSEIFTQSQILKRKKKNTPNTQYALILKNDISGLKLQPQNDCAELHFTHL